MNDGTETVEAELPDQYNAPEDPQEMRRQARELIPVQGHGATALNRAQQVDIAQDMAKARYFVPQFLQGNIGDCVALVQIANESGLSPYLLAKQCYIEPKSGQVALMAQAYHALACSWLVGDLDVEYEGVGEERVCIVSGVLKNSPDRIRKHRSPMLKDVRPERNDRGVTKGSPLWDRKPDVQLFYDTSRDWVRIFCPRATMGLYTGDEMREYGPQFARDVSPPMPPGIGARLQESNHGRAEGPHGEKHVERAITGATEKKERKRKNGKIVETVETVKGGEPVAPEIDKTTAKSEEKTDKPDVSPAAPGPVEQAPKNPEQWKAYCLAWIAQGTDVTAIRGRWGQERALRNAVGVTEEIRGPVMEAMADRCKELGGA